MKNWKKNSSCSPDKTQDARGVAVDFYDFEENYLGDKCQILKIFLH